jgi:hypothetical protein
VATRLPHLSNHDVAEIEAEVRAGLSEIGGARHDMAVTGSGLESNAQKRPPL